MMLSTVFMLFMSAWLLADALQYGVASFPVIALLTAIMVSIRMLQRRSFSPEHIPVLHSAARVK